MKEKSFEAYIKKYIDYYKAIKPEEWTIERLRKQIVLNLQNIKNFGGKYFEKVKDETLDEVTKLLLKVETLLDENSESGETT